jgi:hypothetical protein
LPGGSVYTPLARAQLAGPGPELPG